MNEKTDTTALAGKPVLIAATGGIRRHSLVLDTPSAEVTYLRAATLPTAVFAATEEWGGGDAGEPLVRRVERAAGELAEEVRRRRSRSPRRSGAVRATAGGRPLRTSRPGLAQSDDAPQR